MNATVSLRRRLFLYGAWLSHSAYDARMVNTMAVGIVLDYNINCSLLCRLETTRFDLGKGREKADAKTCPISTKLQHGDKSKFILRNLWYPDFSCFHYPRIASGTRIT